MRQREGRVRDKFAKGSGPYAEFFPQGIQEYTKARLGQIPGLLTRLITAATKYKAELGPELLAENRTALELQVGKNILAIASHHFGSPERATDYFNQSLLAEPTRDVKHNVTPPPVP